MALLLPRVSIAQCLCTAAHLQPSHAVAECSAAQPSCLLHTAIPTLTPALLPLSHTHTDTHAPSHAHAAPAPCFAVFDIDHDEERAAAVGQEVNGFNFEGMDAPGMDYALNRWVAGFCLQSAFHLPAGLQGCVCLWRAGTRGAFATRSAVGCGCGVQGVGGWVL